MLISNRPARLVLIRHPESKRNAAKNGSVFFKDDAARAEVEGIPDHEIEISDLGHAQMESTSARLKDLFGVPDAMYHSGYARTKILYDSILGQYTEDERSRIVGGRNLFIRERESGYCYDMTEEEARAAFPWMKKYWETTGSWFARPPGGESMADTCIRVALFLDMVNRDHAGQTVFVSTHGGTKRCFRFLLEHWDYEQARTMNDAGPPENCGITDYEFDPAVGDLVLQNYNQVLWK